MSNNSFTDAMQVKVSISVGLVSAGQNSDPDDKKERKSFLMLSKKKFLFLAGWFSAGQNSDPDAR